MLKSIGQWNMNTKNGLIVDEDNNFNTLNLDDIDFSKPGILIIDDNEGICSFIEDDLEVLDEEGKIDLDDYNIFVFYGIMCAYDFIATMEKYPNMNIQKAIIDITYSGIVMSKTSNIKLNGVDVFEILHEANPELEYLFYTGNQMNSNIKVIGELVQKYSKIVGRKINDNLLFKTQYNMNDRRKIILERLFHARK